MRKTGKKVRDIDKAGWGTQLLSGQIFVIFSARLRRSRRVLDPPSF